MGQSLRFIRLRKRVVELENLLPAVDPAGNYTKRQQDDIRAYHLLVHAECEEYFEKMALAITDKAYKLYMQGKGIRKPLKSLRQTFCKERTPTDGKDSFMIAVKAFQRTVERNHGVKEYNLCNLLLPLGLDEAKLDTTWLATMNSFGVNRGRIAHTSAAGQAILDPAVHKATVAQVISGIKVLDAFLRKL